MILKALYDYYNRSGNLPPAGWAKKEIEFLIVIDKNGNFVNLENRRIDKKQVQSFIVPKEARSGSAPKPYLFNDTIEYTLCYSEKYPIEKSRAKNEAFAKRCQEVSLKHPDNLGFKAVVAFYQKGEMQKVYADEKWVDMKKSKGNVSFLLQGSLAIVAEDKELQSELSINSVEQDSDKGVCLVTGDKNSLIRLSAKVHLQGANPTGASLVSFQTNSGYDSWGKGQCANAPISQDAEAAYTSALNKLLARDSKNKFVLNNNRSFLFWASNDSEASREAEVGLFTLLENNHEDDPNKNIAKVKEIFKSIYSGMVKTTMDDKFYFLGLAPNAARIAVVYWNECPLRDFAQKLLKHFDDMEIVDTRKDKKSYYGLYNILSTITLGGKVSDAQPNLAEAILKSIIQGIPYPYSLYVACLRRIRAEQDVRIGRAAILKAYLIRKYNDNLTIMVNRENNIVGYLCGRLFAVLEKEQLAANGSTNISERYLNSASATPSAVFPTLLNLSIHHEEKLQKPAQVFYSKLKGEIIDKLTEGEFPSHLSLEDQGRFMVGYYQQKQEFYTKKENNNNE
ncbi:MAG: type I-C CRISPR-associated protein Cas8c/Csd1 [Prevotella sp.]|jgi:CRISPR-associated protein Csd1|nr:type I-C CRISPR-associated protein Cas8c/Csd1 [Prevotella sp.]MCH4240933.1 type I-C CRISPR-associated protein Cas8c/Csd1 [Prevotella sp.]